MIYGFCLSVAVREIVFADPSLGYTSTVKERDREKTDRYTERQTDRDTERERRRQDRDGHTHRQKYRLRQTAGDGERAGVAQTDRETLNVV